MMQNYDIGTFLYYFAIYVYFICIECYNLNVSKQMLTKALEKELFLMKKLKLSIKNNFYILFLCLFLLPMLLCSAF